MKAPQSAHPRPFLSLLEVAFRLGDRLVFENTSWIFHRHEQWAVIGANGSGKSLLADALRGRLPLVRGELRYHFRAPAGLSPEEAIGHVSFEDRKADGSPVRAPPSKRGRPGSAARHGGHGAAGFFGAEVRTWTQGTSFGPIGSGGGTVAKVSRSRHFLISAWPSAKEKPQAPLW
jgi:hypothetical protein